MNRLSIVILTCNQKNITLECLRNLHPLIEHGDFEVIVVDNGSRDGTVQEIISLYPTIKVICNERNLGVSRGRNQGYRKASSEFILQLDNDTIPSVEAIMSMLTYAENNDKVGIVTCRMVDDKGIVQNNCRPYPGVLEKLKSILHLNDKDYSLVDFNNVLESDGSYIIGACQLLRRVVLEKVGYLDERIFYGPEDADICIRTARAGYCMKYLSGVSIVHYYARITKNRPYSRLAFNHLKALIYFYHKYSRWV